MRRSGKGPAYLMVVALAWGLASCSGETDSAPSGTGGTGGAAGTGGAGGAAGTGGTGGAAGMGGAGGTGAQGGSGGSGGTAGSAGSGGSSAAACTGDADCAIANDCCDCVAYRVGFPPEECTMPECFAAACDARQLFPSEARCVEGACILAVPCWGPVSCNALPPECPFGQVPSLDYGQSCWGGCVAANQCAFVESCDVCTAQQFDCVTLAGQAHCVPFGED